jgi:hypothetical protein
MDNFSLANRLATFAYGRGLKARVIDEEIIEIDLSAPRYSLGVVAPAYTERVASWAELRDLLMRY